MSKAFLDVSYKDTLIFTFRIPRIYKQALKVLAAKREVSMTEIILHGLETNQDFGIEIVKIQVEKKKEGDK